MKVRDWMSGQVVTIPAAASIEHGRYLMEQHRVKHLPVVENGSLIGIVSDRDLRDAAPAVVELFRHDARRGNGKYRTEIPVSQIMARQVVTLDENTPIDSAARTMANAHIGAIVVVRQCLDGRRRVVGMLSRGDVLWACASMDSLEEPQEPTAELLGLAVAARSKRTSKAFVPSSTLT
jgi:acetoin utilization protein AcuB